MDQRRVGTSDVGLSVVGLGGAWLGHDPSDSAEVSRAAATLDAAASGGTNWVDTSENYFDTGNEAVIGAALPNTPDAFQVCSKVAPGALASGGGSGFRPEQVRSACQGSLRRLGRDALDVYLLHWPDDTGVPLEDTWGAMAALVDEGLVRAIGMSNYEREDIAACHAQRPVDAVQTGLSVIDYLDDRDLIAWCGERGIAVMVYEPLGNGLLTNTPFEDVRARWVGTAWEDSPLFRRLFSSEAEPRTKQVVAGLAEIAAQLGASVAHVAIAWVLRQPGVAFALAGSANPDRVRDNAGAADLDLPDSAIEAIENLIPLGPAFA
jgi:aryl-alcohol dehydrogenase-like predicted oxidoreductase